MSLARDKLRVYEMFEFQDDTVVLVVDVVEFADALVGKKMRLSVTGHQPSFVLVANYRMPGPGTAAKIGLVVRGMADRAKRLLEENADAYLELPSTFDREKSHP